MNKSSSINSIQNRRKAMQHKQEKLENQQKQDQIDAFVARRNYVREDFEYRAGVLVP